MREFHVGDKVRFKDTPDFLYVFHGIIDDPGQSRHGKAQLLRDDCTRSPMAVDPQMLESVYPPPPMAGIMGHFRGV